MLCCAVLCCAVLLTGCWPLCRINNPSDTSAESATMQVDEDTGTVTVQAGVLQRDILDYLAKHS